MKLNNSFFYTLRQDMSDEDSASSNLLVRSGMIKKASTGTYMFMPLGLRVMQKIEKIVQEEMIAAGSQQVLMPALIHQEIYEQSGRNAVFGDSIFRLNDRYGKPYILGPTHEELFAIAGKMQVKSYKDLPFNLFQFQNKFRDEPRPRYGLIRVREFIMKDAYSFDLDLAGLDVSYQKMFDAYKNIFDRIQLEYVIVRADTGAMGGLLSEEFQAVTDIGEDILVMCDSCDYASNHEIAECISTDQKQLDEKELELIHTPDIKTIKELTEFMQTDAESFVKTVVYKIDGELVACMVSGDREANETKIMKLLGAYNIELPEASEVDSNSNGVVGFLGPVDLGIKIVVDSAILERTNVVFGANKKDYHYKNGSISRDVKPFLTGDISNVKEGDVCPNCGGAIHFSKGIEVGNTFKLGTKYSEAMKLEYLDNENKLHPVVMGSYGLGLCRTMAAIVEQNNDEKGIVWPMVIAPYHAYIVVINNKDELQMEVANKLYDELTANGVDVILDDRKARAGVKFNDAELIGIPLRVTVGRDAAEGLVEFKQRKSDDIQKTSVDDAIEKIISVVKK